MVNGISEEGLSVNHKLKIVNFPSGTSGKILDKLDGKIKNRKIAATNVTTNNVKLSTNLHINVYRVFIYY